MKKEDKIICRDNKITGYVTGETRWPCNQVESCTGSMYQIKWDDGEETWVCGKGLGWSASKSRWYFY